MPLVLDGTNGVSGVDGTASNPAIEGTDSNTGIFYPAADTVAIGTGGTERLRVDSAGNAGLGVTPSAWFANSKAMQLGLGGSLEARSNYAPYVSLAANAYIDSAGNDKYINTAAASLFSQDAGVFRWKIAPSGTAGNAITFTQAMTLDASGNLEVGNSAQANTTVNIRCINTGSPYGQLTFSRGTGGVNGFVKYDQSAEAMLFGVGGSERARITSGGNLLVGKTVTTFSTAGINLATNTIEVTRSADKLMALNRLTSDGALVDFYQDGTLEGNISVSGTTVSYNGGHLARWSQLLNGQRDESILKGTVLSNLDEMCEWLDSEGNPLPNEQLNRMKVSDVEGDTNVAGVFVNWDNDDQDNPYDMNIAMTGDMIIRIAQGVTVQKGDLLMSAGDGTAKPQGDDIVRSKTVAKVTSNHVTCTYDDGSYCVPCVLMAC